MSTSSTGPDCLRTNVTSDVDFNISSDSKPTSLEDKGLKSENSTKSLSVPSITNTLPECQVLLKDILSCGQTEKFKTLRISQDKNHSASSRQSADNIYLENLTKKDPIAWPTQ